MTGYEKIINTKQLKITKRVFAIFLFVCLGTWLHAQESYPDTEKRLRELVVEMPSLEDTLSMSISEWPLQEFLRGVANYSKLNFEIATDIEYKITANFIKVKVVDVLLYVCRQYDLQVSNLGAIFSISKRPPLPPDESREVVYDQQRNTLSLDLKQKPLGDVIRKITLATGRNIVPEPGLEGTQVTAFVQGLPFETAVEKMAFANNMTIKVQPDSVVVVSRNVQREANKNNEGMYMEENGMGRRQWQEQNPGEYQLEISVNNGDSVKVIALNAPIESIITESCRKLGKNYYLNEKIEGFKTFETRDKPFDLFIHELLNSTQYTCIKKGNTYFFGQRSQNDMKESRVIMLQNRTVKKINEILPKYLLADIELTEFTEQNSLVIAGASDKVEAAERFILSIDQPIPVILIEVIIIDMKKSFNISTGIEAGISDKPVTTEGVFFPGFDMQLSSDAINNVLRSFKGLDVKNIGVKPNVYLTLQAMEDQGILKIRSTPKLSTLNGHEAKMAIGKTEYYEEESSNIVGNVGTTVSTYRTYKPVDAELSITITPIVSGSDKVTLEIEVKQSDFTERIKTTAPPGVVRREFKSLIKVQNQETVILGGLEETRKSETARGVPLLSRIPVIKWLFSSRSREDSGGRLNVFIKPTIIE